MCACVGPHSDPLFGGGRIGVMSGIFGFFCLFVCLWKETQDNITEADSVGGQHGEPRALLWLCPIALIVLWCFRLVTVVSELTWMCSQETQLC